MSTATTANTTTQKQKLAPDVRAAYLTILGCAFVNGYTTIMMNVALPHVSDTFHVTLSEANWLVIVYAVVAATVITMSAKIMQRIGVRRIYCVAMGAVVVGSLLGIVGSLIASFWLLLVARIVQALMSGILYPTNNSAIMRIVPKDRQGTLLAINSATIGIGIAVSPLVSGMLLTYVGLFATFVIPLILGALLFIAATMFLKVQDVCSKAHVDLLSVVLAFVGLALFMYGLSEVTHVPPLGIGCMVVGALVLAWFVHRQLKLPEPLLSLAPLAHRDFTFGILLIMFGSLAEQSLLLLLPLYMEGVAGFTAFVAGCFLVVPELAYAASSVASGKIVDKHGIWPLVPVGYLLIVIGLTGVLFLAQRSFIVPVVAISILAFAGVGATIAPDKAVALKFLPPNLVPHGSSINSVFIQVMTSFASSFFVGILSADVLRFQAEGLSKSHAYATGFTHTIVIALGIECAMLLVAIVYARKMRHVHMQKAQSETGQK